MAMPSSGWCTVNLDGLINKQELILDMLRNKRKAVGHIAGKSEYT